MLRKLIILLCLLAPFSASAMETKAAYALLVDEGTKQVLLAKDAHTAMHPSSMTKMVTLYVLFQRLKEGKLKLTDTFPVSEAAWRMQGSKTFVHIGDRIPIEDLIRGIIIQSGNDACVVLAEGISGSEEAFAEEMNRVAASLRMSEAHFVNSTGWPDEHHVMSAHDLYLIASHLISDFPEYYHYFSEREFTFGGIKQQNRNRLLGGDIGVDGLKTGHTDAAGYGITLSAKDPKSGRRLVLVINGLATDNDRVEEGDRLLRYGLREFENVTLAKAGQPVESVDVWFGVKPQVALTVAQDVVATLPVGKARDEVKYTVRAISPVPAPIKQGDHLADLVVTLPEGEPLTIPLVAAEDVGRLGAVGRAWRVLHYYVFERR